ncbi:MAG: hypothetical protein WCJ62_01290 [Flavobacterium sp.]
MKKLFLLLILFTLVSFNKFATTVYVCDGGNAKKYHYSETCRGLNACKHKLITMTESNAQNNGLRLCSWE